MVDIHVLPDHLRPAYERLQAILNSYGSLVVAYSGGVDSGFLSFAARDTLGDAMISVLGVSPSLSERERKAALEFVESHRIPFAIIETEEFKSAKYRENDPDRCYYCKRELFSKLERFARERGFAYIAHGANVDDLSDHRPGARAARERNIVAPLMEAGFTKTLIRETARALGLALWDKPATPCLASRIPYYLPITEEKLRQIENAESALKDLGFLDCRIRHHGDVARIEVPREDCARLFEGITWRVLSERIKKAGFLYVTVDLEGLRSGRLNDVLE